MAARNRSNGSTRLGGRFTPRGVGARPRLLGLALLMFTGGSLAQLPPFYIAQQITGPSGAVVAGFGVNDSAVVGAMQTSGGPIVAWPVGSLPSGTGRGLNNQGLVVGSAHIQTPNGPALVAMEWTPGQSGVRVLSPLDAAGNYTTGVGFAINDAGWIVGQNSLPGQGFGAHPVLWSPAGVMTSLGDRWVPYALNEARHIVGSNSNSSGETAVLWRPGVGLTELAAPATGGIGSRAVDINEAGAIAGFAYGASTGAYYTPVIWTGPDSPQVLSAGGSFSLGATANAINDRGWVAGTGYSPVTGLGPTYTGRSDPILWTGSGSAVNLSSITLMDLGGGRRGLMSDENFIFIEAVDINNRGQILVNTIRLVDNPNPYFTGRFEPYILGRFESYLLSECIRCGQIKPNPNPSGALLDVGPDWVNPFNREAFVNNGELRLFNRLPHFAEGLFDNHGLLDIQSGGRFVAEGRTVNQQGGRIRVAGTLELTSPRGMVNEGQITIVQLGELSVAGLGLVNSGRATIDQRGGNLVVSTDLFFDRGTSLFQDAGGTMVVLGGGSLSLFSATASLLGTNSNNGQIVLAPALEAATPARLTVGAGSLFDNRSGATVDVRDSQWLVSGTLRNRGTFRLRDTSEFWVGAAGATATIVAGGRLEVGPNSLGGARAGGTFESFGEVLNQGALGVFAGSLLVAGGVFVNENGMLVSGSGALLAVPASPQVSHKLENLGTIELRSAGTMEVHGRLDNRGTVDMAAGTTLTNHGTVGIWFDASITGQGTYEQLSGSTLVLGRLQATWISILGGSIGGLGRVVSPNTVTIGLGAARDPSLIIAGNSPGTLTFDADVRLDNALVELEIGDYQHYDRIVVNGQLDVRNAEVRVLLAGGYDPDLNDRFDWLQTSVPATGLDQILMQLPGNLPAGWVTHIGDDRNLRVWNDAAVDLLEQPLNNVVPAGMLAFIDLPRQGMTGWTPGDRVTVEGRLALLQGSTLLFPAGGIDVAAGARMSSRGEIRIEPAGGAGEQFVNRGRFENREGGLFVLGSPSSNAFVNAGRFESYGRFENGGWLNNEPGATFVAGGSFTNALTATLDNRGRFAVEGTLDNQGLIDNRGAFEVSAAGRVQGAGRYYQQGAAASTLIDGRLAAGEVYFFGGRLSGSGTLASDAFMFLGEGEMLAVLPGGEGTLGTLTLEGRSNAGTVRFFIDIAGAAATDRLAIAGDLFFQSSSDVAFVLAGDFTPTIGERYEWLSLAGPGSFVSNQQGLGWSVSRRHADGTLVYLDGAAGPAANSAWRFEFNGMALQVTAVPEPGSWVLFVAGLFVVALSRVHARPAAQVSVPRPVRPQLQGTRSAPSIRTGR